VQKATYASGKTQWEETFAYIRQNPAIEDVVISGGDLFMLMPENLSRIGAELLEIPHVRRIRFATKGLSVMPMRITGDDGWAEAIAAVSDRGRTLMKEVCIHTHFSTEREITAWTERAMRKLISLGVKVRNQCVLLRGVNDEFDVMYRTLKKLSYLNVQPYLVYVHDMVPGCEHLRTTLTAAEKMSKALQGTTAGFNTPRFVCDAPKGGGKREISSYERYDRELGVSAWRAPRVKPGQVFYYFDPIDRLRRSGREIWADCGERERRLKAFREKVERRPTHRPPTRSAVRHWSLERV
jgi:lysine 2,3-aminomutase